MDKEAYMYKFMSRELTHSKGLFRVFNKNRYIVEVKALRVGLVPTELLVSYIPLRPPMRIIDLPTWNTSRLLTSIMYPTGFEPVMNTKIRELAKYYARLSHHLAKRTKS